MAGCLLRVSGRKFDVNSYLQKSRRLKPSVIYRKGERGARNRINRESGMSVVVSSKETFEEQMRQAIQFLTGKRIELRKLRRTKSVESICFDFGVVRNGNELAEYYRFPVKFLQCVADLGIQFELSRYAGL